MKRKHIAGRLLPLLLGWFCLAPAFAGTAVDFTAPDLDGKIHRLSDYRGKWVLVNYWATWCPPCREELPELEVFHDHHKDRDAVVLGLNMEEIDPDQLRQFVEEQFLSYPILLVGSRPGMPLGRIPGLPTSFLVSPKGEVVARQVGPVDRESIEAFIERYASRAQKP
jgi:thiol-disulfide isomerase/thioredoxin